LHEALEPILKDTFGVIIYQEQVTEIVHKIGGFSKADADIVRRMVSKSRGEELIQFEAKFLEYATKNSGLKLEVASELWEQILSFGGYGFNKSHAVAYSLLGYWCQYLKVNYPLEWWAAVLKSAKQKEIQTVYKDNSEIVELPDINKSIDSFYINDENKVVMPITMVHGVGVNAVAEIMQKQPFVGFSDFLNKVNKSKVRKNIIINLIFAGVFRNMCEDTAKLIEDYFAFRKEEIPFELTNLDRIKLIALQETAMPVLYCDYHEYFKDFFKKAMPFEKIETLISPGTKVETGGKIKKVHRFTNRRGDPQAFVTLANEDKELTVVVFKEALSEYGKLLEVGKLALTCGVVNEYNGNKNLILEALEVLYEIDWIVRLGQIW